MVHAVLDSAASAQDMETAALDTISAAALMIIVDFTASQRGDHAALLRKFPSPVWPLDIR
jgi:hypothetical protein